VSPGLGLRVAGLCLTSLLIVLVAPPGPPTQAEPSALKTGTFRITVPGDKRQQASAVWPARREHAERWPVLIAFHGMAESRKGPAVGHRAWFDDYGLIEAYEALLTPPLTPRDFGSLVRPKHLEVMNADLAAHALRGLFVVGVYTPDLFARSKQDPKAIERFADWVADDLLTDIHDTFPVTDPSRDATGVDGVSLGGFVSLSVGCRRPDVIGVVGAMQPAVRGREARIAALCAEAGRKRPQRIRLVSSDDDPFLPATRKLSRKLRDHHVSHELRILPGPHGYAFNRGPGAIDMLWYHDRALRETSAQP